MRPLLFLCELMEIKLKVLRCVVKRGATKRLRTRGLRRIGTPAVSA